VRCGTMCALSSSHKHSAGSPCTDHSSFGKQAKLKGRQAKFFYIWGRLCRELAHNVIIFENVPAFGTASLLELLGDQYVVTRVALSLEQLGWLVARPRQFVCIYLKTFIYPIMQSWKLPPEVRTAEQSFHLDELLMFMFARHKNATWQIFVVSNQSEQEEELAWARSRKLVKERADGHAEGQQDAEGNVIYDDPPDSARSALTRGERTRLQQYLDLFQDSRYELVDLGQNPLKRPLRSKRGILHTLIKGHGITFCYDLDKWLSATDLWTAMGFPITEECQAASAKASCQFSRGRQAPVTRTHATHWHQVGNNMHINFIGAVCSTVLLLVPSLGKVDKGKFAKPGLVGRLPQAPPFAGVGGASGSAGSAPPRAAATAATAAAATMVMDSSSQISKFARLFWLSSQHAAVTAARRTPSGCTATYSATSEASRTRIPTASPPTSDAASPGSAASSSLSLVKRPATDGQPLFTLLCCCAQTQQAVC